MEHEPNWQELEAHEAKLRAETAAEDAEQDQAEQDRANWEAERDQNDETLRNAPVDENEVTADDLARDDDERKRFEDGMAARDADQQAEARLDKVEERETKEYLDWLDKFKKRHLN